MSSSAFGNTTKYPRFFRLLPITEEFVNGFVALVEEFEWKRVAVIAFTDEFMLKVTYSRTFSAHEDIATYSYNHFNHSLPCHALPTVLSY